ncbi:hypothetical protein K0M31_020275 [Melipona bicolor]|uniref:Uncharacterized protein n=1 Tax=Melipona bicolor TaxID=60889 RepID=A0AA40KQT7_9HYME|nr:hypothetical protein K0M31_020275 [Melipona bicolor]
MTPQRPTQQQQLDTCWVFESLGGMCEDSHYTADSERRTRPRLRRRIFGSGASSQAEFPKSPSITATGAPRRGACNCRERLTRATCVRQFSMVVTVLGLQRGTTNNRTQTAPLFLPTQRATNVRTVIRMKLKQWD